ncbi:MAG: hypothetical protein LBH59_10900 [Planctomycetaceae bacterium]|nr:hypothetical protein [Planctomycetaceae bacterium]
MNKRFAMLRLLCSALRILKRLQHNTTFCSFYIEKYLIYFYFFSHFGANGLF